MKTLEGVKVIVAKECLMGYCVSLGKLFKISGWKNANWKEGRLQKNDEKLKGYSPRIVPKWLKNLYSTREMLHL